MLVVQGAPIEPTTGSGVPVLHEVPSMEDDDQKTVVHDGDPPRPASVPAPAAADSVSAPTPTPISEPVLAAVPKPATARGSAPKPALPKPMVTTAPPVARRPAAAPATAPAEDEDPPWMHPYVLVTGGLLLLALGFLIGVILR
jgi:hypothetical protein